MIILIQIMLVCMLEVKQKLDMMPQTKLKLAFIVCVVCEYVYYIIYGQL